MAIAQPTKEWHKPDRYHSIRRFKAFFLLLDWHRYLHYVSHSVRLYVNALNSNFDTDFANFFLKSIFPLCPQPRKKFYLWYWVHSEFANKKISMENNIPQVASIFIHTFLTFFFKVRLHPLQRFFVNASDFCANGFFQIFQCAGFMIMYNVVWYTCL